MIRNVGLAIPAGFDRRAAWLFGAAWICAVLGGAASPLHASFGNPGCNGDVRVLLEYDGDLIAGGSFTLADGEPASRIARWDGTGWHPLGDGVAGDQIYFDSEGDTIVIEPYVEALAVLGGDLIVGGSFTSAGGITTGCIARWDGSDWHALAGGIVESVHTFHDGVYYTFPPQVLCLTYWDGDLYAGGIFRKAAGEAADFIASWDGEVWQPLINGVRGGVLPRVLSLLGDGDRLLVGGDFTSVEQFTSPRLAIWEGRRWHPFNTIGMDREILDLCHFGGEVVAGGRFTHAGGVPAQHIAVHDAVGWYALDAGIQNDVDAVAVFEEDLFAGSYRWTGEEWVNALESNGPIHALTVYRDRLVAGGSFQQLDGRPNWNIAAWPEDFVAAHLTGLVAERQGSDVRLGWRLSDHEEDWSYHVWRAPRGGARERITSEPIAGAPVTTFTDTEAPATFTEYWLQEFGDGVAWHGPVAVTAGTDIPVAVVLAANHPNPFNPATTLAFTLAGPSYVHLAIHDGSGRTVAVIEEGLFSGGRHAATWDGRDAGGRPVASGIYIARIETESGTAARKITLAR